MYILITNKSSKYSNQGRNMTLKNRALILCPVHIMSTPVIKDLSYRFLKNDIMVCKITIYKEVFVKHEQAPTAPKLEGVWVFVDLKPMVKRLIYGPRPFI